MPRQNFAIRDADLCPTCQQPKPVSHTEMATQDTDVIQEGLIQHDCEQCDEHWYTRLTPELKELLLIDRGVA